MNANCSDEAWVESSGSVARPIYFPAAQKRLFGWLHLPAAAHPPASAGVHAADAGVHAASMGLVICSPFGYEAICSHRSLRVFAETAAAIGVPSLRFDYCGTGDSEDIDTASNQLSVWTNDVVDAVDELRRRTGVARVCLMGFRLGALVASLASAECDAVKALIAVAPVTSGRRYLRELRTIQMAAGQKGASPGAEGARAMEISGFALSADTVAALDEADLSTKQLPNVPDILVIDRGESPGARPWADALSERGAKLNYVALPGFVRMMMTAPHLSVVPQSMVGAARDWLMQFAAAERSQGSGSLELPKREEFNSSEQRVSFAATQSGQILTETLHLIPGERRLFGIITARRGEIRRRAVILLNAGATHHVGPNRMYVALARRWAEQGHLVLRIDLGGLGDSPVSVDGLENEVYPATAVDDVRAAVDFIRGRYSGITDITLGGLCSGAYHALRAAVANVAVTRIIMVNPLNFFWQQGKTQNDLLRLGYIHNPRMYRRQNIASNFWKKLFSGQVNVSRLVEIHAKYGGALLRWQLRDLARGLHLPLPRNLGSELEQVASRGIGIVFFFARGEPGIAMLRHQGGSSVKRLEARCRIHTIDGADHIFSQSGPRAELESLLSKELFACEAAARNEASPIDGGSHVNEEPVG